MTQAEVILALDISMIRLESVQKSIEKLENSIRTNVSPDAEGEDCCCNSP